MEEGYTGKRVQQAQMRIVKIRKNLSWLEPPRKPAYLTVMDVLMAPDGRRDAMIRTWVAAVGESWAERQVWVRETTDAQLNRSPG